MTNVMETGPVSLDSPVFGFLEFLQLFWLHRFLGVLGLVQFFVILQVFRAHQGIGCMLKLFVRFLKFDHRKILHKIARRARGIRRAFSVFV